MARIRLVPSDAVMRLTQTGKYFPKKKTPKKKVVTARHPDREGQFLKLMKCFGPLIAEPVRQYVFHKTRKFRFDFAWPDCLVAVEIDGGIFQGDRSKGGNQTGHRSINGLMAGMEKGNYAAVDGWCLLRFHAKDLDQRPEYCVDLVAEAIQRGEMNIKPRSTRRARSKT